MLAGNHELAFHFDNSYARLPSSFFSRQPPVPVRAPQLALFNKALAASLGLEGNPDLSVGMLSGNVWPAGAEPLAQAYAGHQFGHFAILGDGRATLLGEHLTPTGARFDIQLKGSGPTPFSRRGDGRATLGPMLREYIISEAMHGLNIPTTRSLAVVTTGESVFRERPLPGAILTRVAASHIRVGTFEYAATLENPEMLRALAHYTLQRHYPALADRSAPYLELLRAVIDRQASLLAKWMNVGFIHGVMNTDNMAISGETIDYGPCAFMDAYSASTVFSSIDRNGRYAYGNQSRIAEWNLTRFAETLLPLLDEDSESALKVAEETLSSFQSIFQRYRLSGLRAKLGLIDEHESDAALIFEFLAWMEARGADFTSTFRTLTLGKQEPWLADKEFSQWYARWIIRSPDFKLMHASNPSVIPRNHMVELALMHAVEQNEYSVLNRLLAALQSPYEDSQEFSAPPTASQCGYQTFCGT